MKQVVKSAITDDNRLKNIMIFGLEEKKTFNGEAINDAGCVADLFTTSKREIDGGIQSIRSLPSPLGGKKEAGAPRPLKVCMKNVESAQSVIKHGKLLRQLHKGETNGYSVNFKRYSFLPTYLERKETLVEL